MQIYSNKKRMFTLVEIIVAMGVFVILMLMMMDIFSRIQDSWNQNSANARVVENARAIFDTIGEDLKYAVTSRDKGGEICFWTGEYGGNESHKSADRMGPFPVFIVNTSDNEGYLSSKLAEVYYQIGKVSGYEDDRDGDPQLFFKRKVIRSHNSSGSSNGSWDFYGKDSADSSWYKSGSGSDFYDIAGGIYDIQFRYLTFSPRVGDPKIHYDIVELKSDRSVDIVPKAVDVELTLFDPKTDTYKNNKKTKKTFFKRFYLQQYNEY